MSAIRVSFITSKGDRVEASAEPGDILLDVAQAAGMPLEGTCEGQMACSTCHVILPPEWFEKLPRAVEDEEDMLSQVVTNTNNCQLDVKSVNGESFDLRQRSTVRPVQEEAEDFKIDRRSSSVEQMA